MNKNILSITALASAILLSSCGTGVSGENVTNSEETVSESVTVTLSTDDTTQTEATSAETETEPSETATAETETEPSETAAETEAEIEAARYLNVRLNNEKTVYSADSFADKQAVEAAAQLIKGSDRFNAELSQAKELTDIVIDNGLEFTFEPVFLEGITDDFDGDGREESFFMMMPDFQTGEGGLISISSYLCYEDSDGNVTLLPEVCHTHSWEYRPERIGPEEPMLTEIEYDGFSHLLVSMGFNNMTMASYIYSVNGNAPIFETCQKIIGDATDGIGLLCSAPQTPYSWIAVWDNTDKCYVTPEAVEMSEEERAEITADPTAAEVLEEAFGSVPFDQAVIIGGKYYSFSNDSMTRTFLRLENGFELSEQRINCNNAFSCTPEEFSGDEACSIEMPTAEDIILE